MSTENTQDNRQPDRSRVASSLDQIGRSHTTSTLPLNNHPYSTHILLINRERSDTYHIKLINIISELKLAALHWVFVVYFKATQTKLWNVLHFGKAETFASKLFNRQKVPDNDAAQPHCPTHHEGAFYQNIHFHGAKDLKIPLFATNKLIRL